ncbi:MAG: 4Fe-4S dicluster domain-containing protein [Bacteroidota bacterium]
MISQIAFILVFGAGFGIFALQANKIRQAIQLGRPDDRSDRQGERFRQMTLVALGQQKMFKRWIPAIFHLFIYVAFLFTQVELIEIIIDGVGGFHRFFRPLLGGFYTFIISLIEVLSVLAFVGTLIFLARRNLLKIPRFVKPEMNGWPKLDGNIILYLEIVLIVCIFMMNGADEVLYNQGHTHATGIEHGATGSFGFAVSQFVGPALFGGMDTATLEHIERIGWWGHLMTVLAFLIYLPISKHFHVLLAFPNVYFSNVGLIPQGKVDNLGQVTEEMKAILDPSYTPQESPDDPKRFGARDVTDLGWKSLMDAYTCTECGRCTSVCPANLTGKKLSPRKVVMDVRDRLEEIQKYKLTPNEEGVLESSNGVEGAEEVAQHVLLSEHHISEEELRACTTCNACVESCPVNINHLDIILPLRQYLVMEETSMPEEWGIMFNNVENNGAPWAMPAADRFKWAEELDN